jgi:UDP-2-acetamido-2,6-beta-L-arabino-hexul-4-ose reductase
LPGVFGEFGRPHYNSVVATFAYEITNGGSYHVDKDGVVEIIHVQDAIDSICRAVTARLEDPIRIKGSTIQVRELASTLQEMHYEYSGGSLPILRSEFETRLFNTLRSYSHRIGHLYQPALRLDPRGRLFEAVKGGTAGQTFVSWTNPGATRGNHFHTRKFERFLVIEGAAEIVLRKLFDTTIEEIRVDGVAPTYVDIPTFYTHAIKNIGDRPLITVFWTNEIFDPGDPDTVSETVEWP